MSTSTDTEALNARSSVNSPEIDGCAEFEEKLLDAKAETKKQKNSFTKVVVNCQEKSKKCVQELTEFKQKSKDTEECKLELEKRDKVIIGKDVEIDQLKNDAIFAKEYKGKLERQDEVVRDQKAEIDRLNLLIEDLKNKNPDSGDNKGGAGDVISRMLTHDDLKPEKCGAHAGYYKGSPSNQIGKYGFYTHDLMKEFFPEMHSNNKIMFSLEKGAYPAYGAVNYVFSFDGPISYAWGSPSNMWCHKCKDNKNDVACQSDEAESFCKPAGFYANQEYNRNFFTNVCPNLIYDYSGSAIIKAKLVAPLILVNSAGQMINKDGNNTQVYYSQLYPYLKANGRIKDCTGDRKCEEFAEIMKQVAWDTDKPVLLKTPSGNTEKTSTYSYDFDNPDINTFIDTSLI